LSARLDDDRVLMTPSGVSKGSMRDEAMCVISTRGDLIEGTRPSSERAVHLAIYAARPDARAVIHAHAPHAVAWSCTGQALPEAIHPEAELLLGRIPIVPYRTPGTTELAAAVQAAVPPATTSMLLGNHGAVTLGTSLEEAYARLEMLEGYCRLVIQLQAIGSVRRLDDCEMAALLRLKTQVWRLPDDRMGGSFPPS